MGIEADVRKGEHTETRYFLFYCFLALVKVVQIASLQFSSTSSSWPEFMQPFLDAWEYVRLEVPDGWLYLIVYGVVGGLLAVYVFFFVMSQFEVCECLGECGEHEENFLWVLETLFFGFLFIPLSKMSLEMFHCVDDFLYQAPTVPCFEGPHIALFILAIINVIVLGGGGIIQAKLNDRYWHYPDKAGRMRKSVQNFNVKYLSYRLLIVILSVYITESLLARILVCFLVSIIPLFGIYWYLPHLETRYNHLKALQYGAETWSFFCAAIAAGASNPLNLGSTVIFFAGLPIFLVVVFVLSHLNNRRRPPSDEDFGSPIQTTLTPKAVFKSDEVRRLMDTYGFPAERCFAVDYDDEDELQRSLASISGRFDLKAISLKRKTEMEGRRAVMPPHLVDLMSKVIGANQELEVFVCSGSRLRGPAISDGFARQVAIHKSLNQLDLFKNAINDDTATALVALVSQSATLRKLNLGGNQVMPAAREQIAGTTENMKLRVAWN